MPGAEIDRASSYPMPEDQLTKTLDLEKPSDIASPYTELTQLESA